MCDAEILLVFNYSSFLLLLPPPAFRASGQQARATTKFLLAPIICRSPINFSNKCCSFHEMSIRTKHNAGLNQLNLGSWRLNPEHAFRVIIINEIFMEKYSFYSTRGVKKQFLNFFFNFIGNAIVEHDLIISLVL